MLRLTLTLLAALTLTLTACDNDEDVGDRIVEPFPTLTTGNVGNIVICPHVDVSDEATPATQTAPPSCEPGVNFETIPGIRSAIGNPPSRPPAAALTKYIEFTLDDPSIAAVVAIPLEAATPIGRSLTWYTYDSGQWRALETTVTIHQTSVSGTSGLAEGSFDPVPANLILLAEP